MVIGLRSAEAISAVKKKRSPKMTGDRVETQLKDVSHGLARSGGHRATRNDGPPANRKGGTDAWLGSLDGNQFEVERSDSAGSIALVLQRQRFSCRDGDHRHRVATEKNGIFALCNPIVISVRRQLEGAVGGNRAARRRSLLLDRFWLKNQLQRASGLSVELHSSRRRINFHAACIAAATERRHDEEQREKDYGRMALS
jgi:hypothetical protein